MKLMTKGEVAARLSVSQRTVDRLRKRHELPSLTVAGCVRFQEADVEAYLASRTVYRPQEGPIVDGADFDRSYTALVPAADQPVTGAYAVALWACDNSRCGTREVVLKGRTPAEPVLHCPACRGQLRFVSSMDEVLLLPATA